MEDGLADDLRASFPPGLTELPKLTRASGLLEDPILESAFQKENFELTIGRYTRFSVTVAAIRMESHGVPGAIQVSEATYEATKEVFAYELRGTIPVKGKGELKTYLLLGRRDEEGDRAASLPMQEAVSPPDPSAEE